MYSFEQDRRKFYELARNYKKFIDINKSVIGRIDELIGKFEISYLGLPNNKLTKLEIYQIAIKYLNGKHRMSFDEKVIFLIRLCDSECIMFKHFIDYNSKKENANERDIFRERVRDDLGFWDISLLRYEELYFRKFSKDLLSNFDSDCRELLFDKDYDFSRLTPLEIKYTIGKASWYRENYDATDIYTILYHVIFQYNVLHLYRIEQQLLFFILVIDPDYEMLKIYFEESKWDMVEARIYEVFRFYDIRLIRLEKIIHALISPDIVVDYFK